MKTINGVSFDEYAAISANISQGMSIADILAILELEQPDFDEMMKEWEAEFANLMMNDPNLALRFGEIFSNPQVGRFAGKSKLVSHDELKARFPTFEHYLDILFEQEAAAEAGGINQADIFNKYGINVAEFVELGKIYPHYIEGDDEGNELRNELAHHIREKWHQVYSQ